MKLNYERDRVQKIVEGKAVENVLTYEPASLQKIVARIGYIPILQRRLAPDAARRILVTLEEMGFARRDERGWSKGHRN